MIEDTQENLLQMIDNMIRLHFPYEEMYEQIKVCFPNRQLTFDEMLDIVVERVVGMI